MEEAELRRKLKKALQLLLLPRPRMPGVKGWELKRALGKDYMKVVEVLNEELSKLDLMIKIVYEEAEGSAPKDLDRARFFVLMKSPPTPSEFGATGWRIDDASMLAATLAYIIAKHGKAPRKDLERLLKEKFPAWRVDMNLDRFIRRGYIQEEDGVLSIGWRTKAEIDEKTLMALVLSS
ncbi:MAG: hypothetical protein QW815_07710 [Nitrososphaerota archaeon]